MDFMAHIIANFPAATHQSVVAPTVTENSPPKVAAFAVAITIRLSFIIFSFRVLHR